MPVKTSKFTIGILASICLVGVASAQTTAVDDRFKPRIYGSLEGVPAQNAHNAADVSTQSTSRPVIFEPLPVPESARLIPANSPSGSYNYGDVEAEALRVIAFQRAAAPSTEYNAVPQEGRYDVEFYEPVAQENTSITQVNQSQVPQSAAQVTSHYVDDGDTLYNIAKRYNTNVAALKARNNLTGNNISIGDTLEIPGASQDVIAENTVSTVARQPAAQSNLIRTVQPVPTRGVYAVLPKDTLYSISKRACVTVEGIQAQNGLGDGTEIDPGQRLTMPAGHCLN